MFNSEIDILINKLQQSPKKYTGVMTRSKKYLET